MCVYQFNMIINNRLVLYCSFDIWLLRVLFSCYNNVSILESAISFFARCSVLLLFLCITIRFTLYLPVFAFKSAKMIKENIKNDKIYLLQRYSKGNVHQNSRDEYKMLRLNLNLLLIKSVYEFYLENKYVALPQEISCKKIGWCGFNAHQTTKQNIRRNR